MCLSAFDIHLEKRVVFESYYNLFCLSLFSYRTDIYEMNQYSVMQNMNRYVELESAFL